MIFTTNLALHLLHFKMHKCHIGPRGYIDMGEEPLPAAQRKLLEEIGAVALALICSQLVQKLAKRGHILCQRYVT